MPPAVHSFGIEEEFFLVHPRSRQLVRRVPTGLLRECQRRAGRVVCAELLQSQLEVASPVFETSAQAREQLPALRRAVAGVAESMDYRLVAAGTHPLARWQGQKATRQARYAQLMEDFQIVGRRNVLCALHVHCAVPAGVDRVQLMNRLMPWLPVMLALSTSSPFWERHPTGLMSYRQAAYDEWPRTGIPDHFQDQDEYDRFAALMAGQGAIPDASFLWWAIRPSLAHPTLELRICDSCTRVEDTLALAALFRCLVHAHLANPELGAARSAMSRRVIDENRWRAKRWGTAATWVDEQADAPVAFGSRLDAMLAMLGESASRLDCEPELARVRAIATHGTSAHRQLEVYGLRCEAGDSRAAALRAVVDWLIATTLAPAP
ncbi:carboxylate-amine ligase [Arenimonas sp. MALMAid1274]|uniref:carboxylate-amine ligase n=1 Tax=Arenimonas sp. MALMAid1274 TaxID=3411630 RepID=UPI003BA05782